MMSDKCIIISSWGLCPVQTSRLVQLQVSYDLCKYESYTCDDVSYSSACLASVISTYTTSSWMAVCYCQPAYCLQTGNGRLSACAKINLLTRHLNCGTIFFCLIIIMIGPMELVYVNETRSLAGIPVSL